VLARAASPSLRGCRGLSALFTHTSGPSEAWGRLCRLNGGRLCRLNRHGRLAIAQGRAGLRAARLETCEGEGAVRLTTFMRRSSIEKTSNQEQALHGSPGMAQRASRPGSATTPSTPRLGQWRQSPRPARREVNRPQTPANSIRGPTDKTQPPTPLHLCTRAPFSSRSGFRFKRRHATDLPSFAHVRVRLERLIRDQAARGSEAAFESPGDLKARRQRLKGDRSSLGVRSSRAPSSTCVRLVGMAHSHPQDAGTRAVGHYAAGSSRQPAVGRLESVAASLLSSRRGSKALAKYRVGPAAHELRRAATLHAKAGKLCLS
jgi:hypothetical protein